MLCLCKAFHLSVYFSCITLNFKSNHLNQTLNRSAPTCTSRHVPAQGTPALSFSSASFLGAQEEDVLFAYLAALGHSTRSHGERATSTSLIKRQSFKAL